MSRNAKFAMLLCAVTIGMFGIVLGSKIEKSECKSHNYPKDMRFIMYCEPCLECGNPEKEVELSLVSNLGYSVCKNCDSHYTFELNNKGEKVIVNED